MKSCKKHSILLLILLLSAAMLITSCGSESSSLGELLCKHEWQEPTCTQPSTCARCGKTEGEALGHDYEDTTCISQKPCTRCGTYDGMVLTHSWREDGKVCTLCDMDTRTPEERFSEALTIGLTENLYTYAEAHKEGLITEYETLQPYKEEEFLDENLTFWVAEYYTNLEEIKGVLDQYGTDEWEAVYTGWLYHDRSLILYNINKLLPISVPEECRAELQTILDDGESVNSVTLLCEEIDFHDITGSDGKQTYEALAENISLLDFKEFSVEVALLDENESTVETKTIELRNWKKGEKKSLRFSTSAKFKTIDIKYANWVTAKP